MFKNILAMAASAFATKTETAPVSYVAEEFCQYQYDYGWYNFYDQFDGALNFTASSLDFEFSTDFSFCTTLNPYTCLYADNV